MPHARSSALRSVKLCSDGCGVRLDRSHPMHAPIIHTEQSHGHSRVQYSLATALYRCCRPDARILTTRRLSRRRGLKGCSSAACRSKSSPTPSRLSYSLSCGSTSWNAGSSVQRKRTETRLRKTESSRKHFVYSLVCSWV